MMVMNPKAQERAQAQIDAVVGENRLPAIEDRPLLPYVDAILRETIRYSPIVPLCECCLHVFIPWLIYLSISNSTRCCGRRRVCRLSHPEGWVTRILQDFYTFIRIRRSYGRIQPLVSLLHSLCNSIDAERPCSRFARSMAHNESKYPNPHEFIPARFLNDDGTLNHDDVENIAFGFGRRICVGRYFVDTSVWSVAVKLLATFTIEKARDENGVDIPVEPRFSNGVAM